jgi:hypothetical protein
MFGSWFGGGEELPTPSVTQQPLHPDGMLMPPQQPFTHEQRARYDGNHGGGRYTSNPAS